MENGSLMEEDAASCEACVVYISFGIGGKMWGLIDVVFLNAARVGCAHGFFSRAGNFECNGGWW